MQLKIEYLRELPECGVVFTILAAVTTLAIELVIHGNFRDKFTKILAKVVSGVRE